MFYLYLSVFFFFFQNVVFFLLFSSWEGGEVANPNPKLVHCLERRQPHPKPQTSLGVGRRLGGNYLSQTQTPPPPHPPNKCRRQHAARDVVGQFLKVLDDQGLVRGPRSTRDAGNPSAEAYPTTCFRLEFFVLFDFLGPAMGHPRGARAQQKSGKNQMFQVES